MTTLKRIQKIETGFGQLTVKLIVTQNNYQIKLTKVMGRSVNATLLNRDIVNSSSTVDELFERYLSRVSVVDTTSFDNPKNLSASCDIIVSGTTGNHKISIGLYPDDAIRIKSSGFDGTLTIAVNGDTIIIEHNVLTSTLKYLTLSTTLYRYDDENDLVSVSNEA